uniref:Probable deoxycytidylate deaminase n=1 Tax=Acrobeloides nanus TaxID=290746 RepID=A0A914DVZ0_9BILA
MENLIEKEILANGHDVVAAEGSLVKEKLCLKRPDYISWDEYFMYMALLAAQRSKDPSTQVGAIIINQEKIIVGCGYNGMPIGCDDNLMPWGKDSENMLENKYFYVCHAEMNAILNTNSNVSTRSATIYTTMFPCNECAKLIIQSRMSEVVYLKDKPDKQQMQASKNLLQIAGIKFRQFQSDRKTLTLSLE